MHAVTFQAPGEVSVEERPDPELQATDDAIVRIEATGGLRLGPAHLPRTRGDRAGLHDRPRVRRHSGRGRRRRAVGRRRRSRAWLLPGGLRRLPALPRRQLPQVRPLAGLRPRGGSRRAAGHAGRARSRPPRQPHAPAGAGRDAQRRRAVRRRRHGHRLPRGRAGARGRQRRRPRAGAGRPVRRAGGACRGRRAGHRRRLRAGAPGGGAQLRRDAGPPDRRGPARGGEGRHRGGAVPVSSSRPSATRAPWSWPSAWPPTAQP